jgi:hypothetical protein
MTALLIISLTLFSWYFIIDPSISFSLLALIMSYGIVMFWIIDYKDRSFWRLIKVWWSLALLLSICWVIIHGFSGMILLSIWLICASFWYLCRVTTHELTNKIIISSRSMFHTGGFMFTVLSTIGYVCYSLWLYEQFTLTCTTLYSYYNGFITTFTRPFIVGWDHVLIISTIAIVIFWIGLVIRNVHSKKQSKIKKVWLGVLIMVVWLFGLIYVWALKQYDLWRLEFITVNVESVKQWREWFSQQFNIPLKERLGISNLSGLSQNSSIDTNWSLSGNWITGNSVGWLDYYRQILIEQVISDNKKANQTICDFLIGEIGQRYDKPAFKYSAIALLFVLISPLARIVILIISTLSRLLFLLLRWLKVYSFEIKETEVEEII